MVTYSESLSSELQAAYASYVQAINRLVAIDWFQFDF